MPTLVSIKYALPSNTLTAPRESSRTTHTKPSLLDTIRLYRMQDLNLLAVREHDFYNSDDEETSAAFDTPAHSLISMPEKVSRLLSTCFVAPPASSTRLDPRFQLKHHDPVRYCNPPSIRLTQGTVDRIIAML